MIPPPQSSLHNQRVFKTLMEAVKCRLFGQVREALFEAECPAFAGWRQYRRNM